MEKNVNLEKQKKGVAKTKNQSSSTMRGFFYPISPINPPLMKIPQSLKYWFILHFVLDMLFAIPLIAAPVATLTYFGFEITEPALMARLVGAALIGVGGTSLLAHKKGLESYNSLLTLKILWSHAAVLAILLAILEGAPEITWLILSIFIVFAIVWDYYKIKLNK